MANVGTGARIIGSMRADGSLKIQQYVVPSTDGTAIYAGDFVKLATGTDTSGKYGTVTAATASTDLIAGIVVGVVPIFGTPSGNYRAASVAQSILVCDDPLAKFVLVEDGVGGAIAYTSLSGDENASIIYAAGSTATGFSGTMLDSSTIATTNTLQLKVLGIEPRPDNVIGTAQCMFICTFNTHQFMPSTTGV